MASIGQVRFGTFLAQFEKRHPGLELAGSEGTIPDLTNRLQSAEIDIAIMTNNEEVEKAFNTRAL